MLSPELEAKRCAVTVELPLHAGGALPHTPLRNWTAEQVAQWLATAEGGRFSNLALPAGLGGADLMRLDQTSLTALFAGQLRKARVGEEGAAWVVDTGTEDGSTGGDGASSRTSVIGRALWRALRRETSSAQSAAKAMPFL